MASTRGERHCLLISYLWPPAAGVGWHRAWSFAAYLPQWGWRVTVLTATPDDRNPGLELALPPGVQVVIIPDPDCLRSFRWKGPRQRSQRTVSQRVVQEPGRQSLAGRLKRMGREIVAFPDDQVGWYKPALARAEALCAADPPTVILSSSPPETSHLLARSLARATGRPWVADLRDLWSDDHYRERSSWMTARLRRLERDTLGEAAAVVTVTDEWAERLATTHPFLAQRIVVIPNGFDPDAYKEVASSPLRDDGFRLVYTGKLHPVHQPIEPLFEALGALRRAGRLETIRLTLRFALMGSDVPDLEALAARHGVEDLLVLLGPLPRVEALAEVMHATACLFVPWAAPGGEGWHSAKVFEYLGARRPVLVVGPVRGALKRLFEELGGAEVAPSAVDLGATLGRWIDEYEHRGVVHIPVRGELLARYTRQRTTADLADLLHRLVAPGERVPVGSG